MTLDEAKVTLRDIMDRAAAKPMSGIGEEADAIRSARMVLAALDAAEARATAAEAGQRAYGEVLLALASDGPKAPPVWGPVAQALYPVSVGHPSDLSQLVCAAMNAADEELERTRAQAREKETT